MGKRGLLLNGEADFLRKNIEKVEVLNAAFASFFTGKVGHRESPGPSKEVWSKEDLPFEEEDRVKEHLNKLDTQQSVGPDRTHPRALWEPMSP